MNLKIKLLLLISLLIIQCSTTENNEPEETQDTFLCCTDENPFASLNVDNLNQSNGEIFVIGVITPNGDAILDAFSVENLQLYPNNTITIFDLDENIVFETQNGADFFTGINQNTNTELPFGTYKYKIVVENESTFVEFGYLCLLRNYETEADGHSFVNCILDANGNIIVNDPEIR